MQFSFEAIGTHWIIDIGNNHPDVEQKILQRIKEFDKNYSRFRNDSLIAKFSETPGTYTLPDDAKKLFDFYKTLYNLTGGLLTPLIGKTMEQSGYDKKYSLQPGEITKPLSWEEALEYNFPTLTVKQPVTLDFGAAGKGYLIDIIGGLITQENINSYTIDAGGDILHHSDSPIKVGLEDPINTSQAIGIATIKNQSIAGSAGNRRKWDNFHHIINPETLLPVNEIAAVWVIADTAMIADGLATALYLKPEADLFRQFKFEYLILFSDRSIQKSDNFAAEIFTT